jgi:hypothetical protein
MVINISKGKLDLSTLYCSTELKRVLQLGFEKDPSKRLSTVDLVMVPQVSYFIRAERYKHNLAGFKEKK